MFRNEIAVDERTSSTTVDERTSPQVEAFVCCRQLDVYLK